MFNGGDDNQFKYLYDLNQSPIYVPPAADNVGAQHDAPVSADTPAAGIAENVGASDRSPVSTTPPVADRQAVLQEAIDAIEALK